MLEKQNVELVTFHRTRHLSCRFTRFITDASGSNMNFFEERFLP